MKLDLPKADFAPTRSPIRWRRRDHTGDDPVDDRGSFPPPLTLEDGYDIRTVRGPLGHKDISTTMIYPTC